MTDPSDKAKWDALAEMLGAKISQPEKPPATRGPESVSKPRERVELPPPPRKRGDWDALAGELGIESPARADAGRPSPKREEKRESPADAQPGGSEPVVPEAAETVAPSWDDRQEAPDEELTAAESPEPSPVETYDEEVTQTRVGPGSRESKEQQTAPPARQRERREGRRKPEGTGRGPEDRAEGERHPRRRRRRGPRQREAAADETAPRTVRAEAEELEELDAELLPSTEAERPARHDSRDRRESGGAKRASHKSIPSWSEAIGIMIEGNLASRSTRRRPSSGAGRGRGRRGRRG